MANIVSRDVRSNTGKNLFLLREESGLDPWVCKATDMKERLLETERVVVDEQDVWRIKYLETLLIQKQELQYCGEKDQEERINELLSSLCIN